MSWVACARIVPTGTLFPPSLPRFPRVEQPLERHIRLHSLQPS